MARGRRSAARASPDERQPAVRRLHGGWPTGRSSCDRRLQRGGAGGVLPQPVQHQARPAPALLRGRGVSPPGPPPAQPDGNDPSTSCRFDLRGTPRDGGGVCPRRASSHRHRRARGDPVSGRLPVAADPHAVGDRSRCSPARERDRGATRPARSGPRPPRPPRRPRAARLHRADHPLPGPATARHPARRPALPALRHRTVDPLSGRRAGVPAQRSSARAAGRAVLHGAVPAPGHSRDRQGGPPRLLQSAGASCGRRAAAR